MLLWILVAFVVIALVDSLLIFAGIRNCGCSKPNATGKPNPNTGNHKLVASTATNANINSATEPNTGTVITWQSGNTNANEHNPGGAANGDTNPAVIGAGGQTNKRSKANKKRVRTMVPNGLDNQKGCDCAKPNPVAYADDNY